MAVPVTVYWESLVVSISGFFGGSSLEGIFVTAASGGHALTPSIKGRDSALYAVRWLAGRGSL